MLKDGLEWGRESVKMYVGVCCFPCHICIHVQLWEFVMTFMFNIFPSHSFYLEKDWHDLEGAALHMFVSVLWKTNKVTGAAVVGRICFGPCNSWYWILVWAWLTSNFFVVTITIFLININNTFTVSTHIDPESSHSDMGCLLLSSNSCLDNSMSSTLLPNRLLSHRLSVYSKTLPACLSLRSWVIL
jgi:hypothetical protein